MTVRVGINGFGRIGRLAFRRLQKEKEMEVVAINDLTAASMLANLLKYDSTQGRFAGEVACEEDSLIIDGRKIKVLAEREPENLPWAELGVDIVLECTGFFATKTKAEKHLLAGAGKVVISAPAGDDVPTIVYNVNHLSLTGKERVISAASCTTNCLAPMAKVLSDTFGIVTGLMTTIHAYTGDQMTLDGPHRKGDFRRARAAACNLTPTSTGAARAIGLVIPELSGKLDGVSQRIPVPAGSLTELVTVLGAKVSVEEINRVMKANSNESFGYNVDPIVSSDVIGMTYGSLFDETLTRVMTNDGQQLVKTAAWYDNEMSYAAQLVRTLRYFAKL